jgi:hypothetical protein
MAMRFVHLLLRLQSAALSDKKISIIINQYIDDLPKDLSLPNQGIYFRGKIEELIASTLKING